MTDRPSNREIADRLKRTWRYRWFELRKGRTFESDMIAEIVKENLGYNLIDGADWTKTYGAEEMQSRHCRTFGISPLVWIALARLVIDLLRWWQERRQK